MTTIPLADLHARAASRPPGYVADVLAHASSVTDTHYTLSDEAMAALRAKYGARCSNCHGPHATADCKLPSGGGDWRLDSAGNAGCGCK